MWKRERGWGAHARFSLMESNCCCFITAFWSMFARSEAHEPMTTELTTMPIRMTAEVKTTST